MPWGACVELSHERGLAHLDRLLDHCEQIWSTVTIDGPLDQARRMGRADVEAGLVWLSLHAPHHWAVGFFGEQGAMITSVRSKDDARRAHAQLAAKARRAFVTVSAPAYLLNPFNLLVEQGV